MQSIHEMAKELGVKLEPTDVDKLAKEISDESKSTVSEIRYRANRKRKAKIAKASKKRNRKKK